MRKIALPYHYNQTIVWWLCSRPHPFPDCITSKRKVMVAGRPPIDFVAILKGSGSSRIVEGISWVGRRHKATELWVLEKWGS